MKNPFIAMAMAMAMEAVAMQQAFRSQALAAFNRGEFSDDTSVGGYRKNPVGTVAQAKRAAIKAKNRARNRASCKRTGG